MAGQRTYNSNKNKRHLNVVKRKYGTIDWAFGGDEIGERGQVVATFVVDERQWRRQQPDSESLSSIALARPTNDAEEPEVRELRRNEPFLYLDSPMK